MSAPTTEHAAVRDRVRRAIVGSGMVQRECARASGMEETKLSKSLAGRRRFAPGELIRIADATGVTVSWLLGEEPGDVASPKSQVLPTRYAEGSERARRRREIIEAAWRLFAAKGFAAVRIADIAEECRTSSATVHNYFTSKREIFAEVLRYSVKMAFDRQVAVLQSIDDSREKLLHLIDIQTPHPGASWSEFSVWMQTWSEVAVGGIDGENHRQAYLRWFRTVEDVVARGQARGDFIAGPADVLASEVTSLVDGLGIKVVTGMITADEMRDGVAAFIDRALVGRDVSSATRDLETTVR